MGAIVTAWSPAQGVEGVVDVLLGAKSPSGRLPVSWYYQSYAEQVPMTSYRMRPFPGRTHRYLQVPVLYPFGHGLSYTTFAYSKPAVVKTSATTWKASVTVTNKGEMAPWGGGGGGGGRGGRAQLPRGSRAPALQPPLHLPALTAGTLDTRRAHCGG